MIKDSLHSLLSGKSSRKNDLLPDLRDTFFTAISGEFTDRRFALESEWPAYNKRLSSLSDEQLEKLQGHIGNSVSASSVEMQVRDMVLVSWTNFLAMADNGHKGWDFWEKNGGKGAVPSEDAAKAPTTTDEDPSRGNIDPAHTRNLVSSHGDPVALPGMQSYAHDVEPSTGVLEVFCDSNGLVSEEYGMTIANVGPRVRERLMSFGRVGKLPVNKNIHILSSDPNEGVGNQRVIASVLVTADGYIRKVTWSAPGGAHRAEWIAGLVENVQNLPLSLMRK